MSSNIFDSIMNYSSDSNRPVSEKPKVKQSDLLLQNIAKCGFSMDQLEEVIKTSGNQLIVSIAGSGKTTAIIFKIMYDIVSGEATKVVGVNNSNVRVLDRIWVCTFLKSGADELRSRLTTWQGKLGVMQTADSMAFSTLHAEFKRALTGLGVSTNIIDAGVNSKNLKEIVNKFSIQHNNRPLNSEYLKNLEGALTYTRNRLDNSRYDTDIYRELGIGKSVIDLILGEWKQSRRNLGCVDFEDLQEILYEECYVKNNTKVIEYLGNRYSYIYIDEFQDTSQIQYALLKLYAQGCKKIVAIGDDDQTIYSWRGSYQKIITEEFAKDFNPTISKLSVNYRCPSVILDAIKPSLELNEFRFKKELKSAKEGGVLRFGAFGSYKSMGDTLTELVLEDVIAGRSVAILCRVNSDGLLPAIMLDIQNRFKYTISGEGMTLDSYIGRQVIAIARLFTERYTTSVKNVLSQLTRNQYSIMNIMKVCKNNRVSFWDIPDKDIIYSCPDIANTLLMFKSWRNAVGDIDALKMIYAYFRESVYVGDSQYNDVCKSVISTVEYLLGVTKAKDVESFIEELELINERLKARKKKADSSNVRIATVHEYKGKEADSVYIWNDSKEVFPFKKCNLENQEDYEEERRIHYIACTRARQISTIMCLDGLVGSFANEMDLSNAERITPKISNSLPKKEHCDTKVLEDEDFVLELKPSSVVKEEINALSEEDKETIWNMFLSNGKDFEALVPLLEVLFDYSLDMALVEDFIDYKVRNGE